MRFTALLVFLVISANVLARTCNGVTLNSQKEVDEFKSNYPNCDSLAFLDLSISIEDPIRNLDSLKNIVFVEDIFCSTTATIADFSGLDGLQHIEGDIFYDEWINDRSHAQFMGLKYVGGSIVISSIDRLEVDVLFPNLECVVDRLLVRNNEVIGSLPTIGAAGWTVSTIDISTNIGLVDIDFLRNCGGANHIEIDANFFLQDISALELIGAEDIGFLSLTDNFDLKICGYCVICDLWRRSRLYLFGNGDFCEFLSDIASYCSSDTLLIFPIISDDCIDVIKVDTAVDIDQIYTVRNPLTQLLCTMHPRGNRIGTVDFGLKVLSEIPANSPTHCQRLITVDPSSQPVSTVLLGLFYSDDEVQRLMEADSSIESLDDLRVSISEGDCDAAITEVTETIVPIEARYKKKGRVVYIEVLATSLGTFYLHGPEGLVLSDTEVAMPPVAVYPNPAQASIYVESMTGEAYFITDITGKPVIRGILSASSPIDISFLHSGVFILSIGDRSPTQHRFIKL